MNLHQIVRLEIRVLGYISQLLRFFVEFDIVGIEKKGPKKAYPSPVVLPFKDIIYMLGWSLGQGIEKD